MTNEMSWKSLEDMAEPKPLLNTDQTLEYLQKRFYKKISIQW